MRSLGTVPRWYASTAITTMPCDGAAADAERGRRVVVSDTSYEGNTEIPRFVMDGYAVMVAEALRQMPPGVSRHGKCYRRTGRRAINDVTEAGVPQEGTRVGPQARHEYLAQMRGRYLGASRREKGPLAHGGGDGHGLPSESTHSGLATTEGATRAGTAPRPPHAL